MEGRCAMYKAQRYCRGMVGVFFLVVLMALCLSVAMLANAPVLTDLQVVSIASSFSGDAWVVQVALDVFHDPINEVTSLVVTAYDSATGNWDVHIVNVCIVEPFQFFGGSTAYDYMVTVEIPKSDSGRITIEARAVHGDDWASTLWEDWIPQEPRVVSTGGLKLPDAGIAPTAVGVFDSTQWILSVSACRPMIVTLDTLNCRLLCADPIMEVPTWWRVWDSSSDNDGEHDSGELVDTGWIPAAGFIAHWNLYEIGVPAGWSVEIRFQLRMERSHHADRAASYSATLGVDVHDEI